MKIRRNDFAGLFGEADPGFTERARGTLGALPPRGKRAAAPRPRRAIGKVALAAALVALVAGATLAATDSWDALDFLRKYGREPLPEATGMARAPEQTGGDGERARYVVREVLYDGYSVNAVIDAFPKEGVLLVQPDSELHYGVSDLGAAFEGIGLTIGEYAEREGYDEVVRVNIRCADLDSFVDGSLDNEGREGGIMTYMYSFRVAGNLLAPHPVGGRFGLGDEITVALVVNETSLTEQRKIGGTAIRFDVQAVAHWGPMVCEGSDAFAEAGIRVDGVSVSGSPLSTYVGIEYAVIDPARLEAAGIGVGRHSILPVSGCGYPSEGGVMEIERLPGDGPEARRFAVFALMEPFAEPLESIALALSDYLMGDSAEARIEAIPLSAESAAP